MIRRLWNAIRWTLQTSGSRYIKSLIWNREFANGRWDALDETKSDPVYELLIKYIHNGDILDLGCGAGTVGFELPTDSFEQYVGIDISDVSIGRARGKMQTRACGDKLSFVHSDIENYVPSHDFDVILFRESIYYISPRKIVPLLKRYSKYLKKSGVFVVKMWSLDGKNGPICRTLEANFEVAEKRQYEDAVVVVFSPA